MLFQAQTDNRNAPKQPIWLVANVRLFQLLVTAVLKTSTYISQDSV